MIIDISLKCLAVFVTPTVTAWRVPVCPQNLSGNVVMSSFGASTSKGWPWVGSFGVQSSKQDPDRYQVGVLMMTRQLPFIQHIVG